MYWNVIFVPALHFHPPTTRIRSVAPLPETSCRRRCSCRCWPGHRRRPHGSRRACREAEAVRCRRDRAAAGRRRPRGSRRKGSEAAGGEALRILPLPERPRDGRRGSRRGSAATVDTTPRCTTRCRSCSVDVVVEEPGASLARWEQGSTGKDQVNRTSGMLRGKWNAATLCFSLLFCN